MKKWILYSIISLFFSCCSRGVWNFAGAYPTYRPKHSKFKILKKAFVPNNSIDTIHFYLSINKSYYDGSSHIGCYGFFGSGKMINTGGGENEIRSILSATNSFATAPRAGYYTTEGNKIEFEYFVPGDGGQYERQTGLIKKDTIILSDTINLFFSKEVRNDTLVKSSYGLK